ncbi:MAG: hypothetical protein ACPGR5_07280, partial [Chitinophagales bacterium]
MKYIVTLSLFFFLNPIFTQYSKSELQEICKVWGIIKYKTNSSQEIDLELISILENKLTLDEFVSKRNIKGITSTKSDSLLFKDSKLLGVSSKAFLSELLDKKNPKNYSFNTIKRNNEGFIILKEKTYEKDLNSSYKLLGVFRLWNYLHYFFLKPNTKEKLKINLANSLEFILK